jgi:hypothetical protein
MIFELKMRRGNAKLPIAIARRAIAHPDLARADFAARGAA